jgi:hypothetical protein
MHENETAALDARRLFHGKEGSQEGQGPLERVVPELHLSEGATAGGAACGAKCGKGDLIERSG